MKTKTGPKHRTEKVIVYLYHRFMTDDEFKNLSRRIEAGLVKHFGVDPDLARGAIHDAYISIHHRGVEHIDPKAFPHYWFIASRHKLIDAIKDQNKFRLTDDEYHLQKKGHFHDPFNDPSDDLYEHHVSLYWQIMALVVNMNRRYRVAFVERYVWRRSYDEIADILDVSEGNARVIVTRAKHELRKLYTQKTQL